MVIPQLNLSDDGGSCIQRLIKKGKERGFVTVEEILECIPTKMEEDLFDEIVETIEDMGINVAR